MKEVTRYQCEYCGKEFRTPNRHKCKYNPEFKNCYTCAHNRGFESEKDDYNYGTHTFAYCEISNGYEVADNYYNNSDGTTRADQVSGELLCDSHSFCGKWQDNEHNKVTPVEKIKEDDLFLKEIREMENE